MPFLIEDINLLTKSHWQAYYWLCFCHCVPGVKDKINESTIHVTVTKNTTGEAIITWEPPAKPNGLILTYNIFYKRAHQENVSTDY